MQRFLKKKYDREFKMVLQSSSSNNHVCRAVRLGVGGAGILNFEFFQVINLSMVKFGANFKSEFLMQSKFKFFSKMPKFASPSSTMQIFQYFFVKKIRKNLTFRKVFITLDYNNLFDIALEYSQIFEFLIRSEIRWAEFKFFLKNAKLDPLKAVFFGGRPPLCEAVTRLSRSVSPLPEINYSENKNLFSNSLKVDGKSL